MQHTPRSSIQPNAWTGRHFPLAPAPEICGIWRNRDESRDRYRPDWRLRSRAANVSSMISIRRYLAKRDSRVEDVLRRALGVLLQAIEAHAVPGDEVDYEKFKSSI